MKDKKYLKYIHTLNCIVTDCEPYGFSDIVAHHITVGAKRGISQKPSDYRCIPLEAKEHMRLHHVGESSYWLQMGIDPFLHAMAILDVYLCCIGKQVSGYTNLDEMISLLETAD